MTYPEYNVRRGGNSVTVMLTSGKISSLPTLGFSVSDGPITMPASDGKHLRICRDYLFRFHVESAYVPHDSCILR